MKGEGYKGRHKILVLRCVYFIEVQVRDSAIETILKTMLAAGNSEKPLYMSDFKFR